MKIHISYNEDEKALINVFVDVFTSIFPNYARRIKRNSEPDEKGHAHVYLTALDPDKWPERKRAIAENKAKAFRRIKKRFNLDDPDERAAYNKAISDMANNVI